MPSSPELSVQLGAGSFGAGSDSAGLGVDERFRTKLIKLVSSLHHIALDYWDGSNGSRSVTLRVDDAHVASSNVAYSGPLSRPHGSSMLLPTTPPCLLTTGGKAISTNCQSRLLNAGRRGLVAPGLGDGGLGLVADMRCDAQRVQQGHQSDTIQQCCFSAQSSCFRPAWVLVEELGAA